MISLLPLSLSLSLSSAVVIIPVVVPHLHHPRSSSDQINNGIVKKKSDTRNIDGKPNKMDGLFMLKTIVVCTSFLSYIFLYVLIQNCLVFKSVGSSRF